MVENPNGRMIRANDPILIMLMKDKKDTAIQKSEIDYSIREMNDKLYSIKLEKDSELWVESLSDEDKDFSLMDLCHTDVSYGHFFKFNF